MLANRRAARRVESELGERIYMQDLVSIVLPVYNGEKYIRESIDSVLHQTYQNWELLILDDCSTDATARIAMEYAGKDPRILYHRNEKNLRLPRNLNRGFSLAKGVYLTWTSDDNRYKPKAIETMVRALEQNRGSGFAFASCRIIDAEGREIEYIMVGDHSKKRVVGSNGVGACFLYTRAVYEAVGEYDPDYALVEDFDYWQRIMSRFDSVAIPEILYEYRWHDGALTSTMRKELFYTNLERMLLKNKPLFGKLDAEQKYFYYSGLYHCRENLGGGRDPYRIPYCFYRIGYFVFCQVPHKLRRMLHL